MTNEATQAGSSEEAPSHPSADARENDQGLNDLLQRFLKFIPEHFDATVVRTEMRVTSKGLFVGEQHLKKILTVHHSWLVSEHGETGAPTPEKAQKRLLNGEWPPLQYLVDGKTCIPGYLLELDFGKTKGTKIPVCQGTFQDPRSNLHLRDPLLFKIDGLSAKVSARGLELAVFVDEQRFEVTLPAVHEFGDLARKSARIRKRSPRVVAGLREGLRVLVKLFPKARSVKEGKQLLVPAKYRKARGTDFRSLGSVVFIVDSISEGNKRIVGCYDMAGRGFQSLFFSELDFLRNAGKGRERIGDFRVFSKRGKSLGTIETDRDTFKILMEPVQEFIQRAPRTRSLRNRFRGFYTIRDGVREFGKMFKSSAWILHADLPSSIREGVESGATYRTSGDWYFVIKNRNEVHACLLRESGRRSETSPRIRDRIKQRILVLRVSEGAVGAGVQVQNLRKVCRRVRGNNAS